MLIVALFGLFLKHHPITNSSSDLPSELIKLSIWSSLSDNLLVSFFSLGNIAFGILQKVFLLQWIARQACSNFSLPSPWAFPMFLFWTGWILTAIHVSLCPFFLSLVYSLSVEHILPQFPDTVCAWAKSKPPYAWKWPFPPTGGKFCYVNVKWKSFSSSSSAAEKPSSFWFLILNVMIFLKTFMTSIPSTVKFIKLCIEMDLFLLNLSGTWWALSNSLLYSYLNSYLVLVL